MRRGGPLPGAPAPCGDAPPPPLRWPAEALWQAVAPVLPGFTVEVLPQIDSTNSELMRRARAGQMEPVLLVAEQQTAGRGRLGRSWHGGAEPGEVLTFSLGLPLDLADWSGLSLAVGLSLAQSLHPALQLKWPNDLWLQGRKLAGILIETAQLAAGRYAVVGVGINIQPLSAEGLATPPAWLRELEPALDAPGALLRVVPPLVETLRRFAWQGWAPLREDFARRDALAGRDVRLSDGTVGVARGVDERGALLVHTSEGLRCVSSSEVSLRPAP